MVRVRFAPSPTGHLHIGAARTAIYNWLFARHHGGSFILRIEDTDFERSSEEMTAGILAGLKWLGLDWDEKPVFQSQRIKLYQEKAAELVKKGAAYYCSEGSSKAVRFKVPDEDVFYKDLIHGPISVQSNNIEDFVLLRSNGLPTYHLSVVVDDIDLGITHIIRGDDHISNTPKQILLYRALGVSPPEFAHQSLIFGPDKKKLSKRHGVTSVLQFRDMGILPLALFNYLAQMSWDPGEERIYSRGEIIEKFYLDKSSQGSPVFDISKLEWINGRLISDKSAEELFPLVKAVLKEKGLWQQALETEKRPWFLKLIRLLKERSRKIEDFSDRALPFISDDFPYEGKAVNKYLKDERLGELLARFNDDLIGLESFKALPLEKALRRRAEKEGIKPALLIHAARVLVLGTRVSPGIFDVLEVMGKEKTIERLAAFDSLCKSCKQ